MAIAYASAGYYRAAFTVSDSKGAISSATVDIKAGTARKPGFYPGPKKLRFKVSKSALKNNYRTFEIFKRGIGPLPWTTSCTANWLNCSPSAGVNARSVGVTVDPSNLMPGLYKATITISAPTASPVSVK